MNKEAPALGLVVEGHGDVQATPVLVRRITEANSVWVDVLHPHRVPKTRMTQELPRAVRLQLDRVGSAGGVLVLVDADSDDPAQLVAGLLEVLDADLCERTCIVVATKEYEAWFLGGLESLRAHRSVRDDAHFDGDPESPRDAKGPLGRQMTESYQETIHQAAFSAIMDLDAVARACPSFVRLTECLKRLLGF